jgi:hypothetical protein
LERRREHVRALLSTLVKELTSHRDDRLRTAEIDPTRLDKIADMAAAAAFSKVSGAFPLPLFQAVEFTPDLLQSFMLRDKRRFSELAGEAFCNQEDACALQQRLDDEAKPVIAQGQALVLQHPSVAALDRPAALAQS